LQQLPWLIRTWAALAVADQLSMIAMDDQLAVADPNLGHFCKANPQLFLAPLRGHP